MEQKNTWCADETLNGELIRLAFEHLGDGVFLLNQGGDVLYANEAARRALGCTCEETLSCRVPDFDQNISDELWLSRWEKAKRLGSYTQETTYRSKNGHTFPVEVTVSYFSHDNREFNCVIARDISTRRELEESMKMAAAIYRSSNTAVMVTDERNRIVDINPAFTRITGYTLEDLYGKDPGIFRSNLHDRDFYQEMWKEIADSGHWQGELWDKRKNGELFACHVNISLLKYPEGNISLYVAQFSEITEKKKRDELVWQHANYDYLTGLPNRRLFNDRFGQEIKKAGRARRELALLFIDLDEFKRINDCFGHDMGDLLLVEAGRRIAKCVRETDTVARLGGDEYTVILTDIGGRSDIERVVQQIIRALGEPFMLETEVGIVSASIGVALYPSDAREASGLLKCADHAMYEAKKSGKGRFAFATESKRHSDARNSYGGRRLIYLRHSSG